MVDHSSFPKVSGTNTAGLDDKAFGRTYLHVSLIIASFKFALPLFLTQEFFFFFFFFFVFLLFIWAAPTAYGGSQDRGSNRSCSHRPMPETQQCGIRAVSATYTTAHGNAGSLTH